jgi:hypothetical protein
MPNLDARKGKVLGFDGTTGAMIAVANVPTSGAVVTAFTETLLDDSTAGAALGTLGAARVVDTIAALKATPSAGSIYCHVLGWYAVNDGGGGLFRHDASDITTPDDGGLTIVATDTARWKRQLANPREYTPEMFGAKGDGSYDDEPHIQVAIDALSTAGGGVLRLNPKTYLLGTYSGNGLSMLNLKDGVSIIGAGQKSIFKLKTDTNVRSALFVATGSGTDLTVDSVLEGTIVTNHILSGDGVGGLVQITGQTSGTPGGAGVYTTSSATTSSSDTLATTEQFAYMLFSVSPNEINDVVFKDFTLDYNGTNNCAIDTIWAVNCQLGFEVGDNVLVDNVTFINNSGSNGILIGRNLFPATVTNLRIRGCHFAHCGDNINPVAVDHSALWVTAENCTIESNTFSNGPKTNGAAIEMHGRNVHASGNVINSYFNGVNIANEEDGVDANPNHSYLNSFCNNNMYFVNCGITVWSDSNTSQVNVLLSGNNIQADPDGFQYFIDADSQVAVDGNNINISITGNVLENPDTVSALFRLGINVGAFSQILISNNQVFGSPGPGIYISPNSLNGAVINIQNNQVIDCGYSTFDPAFEVGIMVRSTATTAAIVNIHGNSIVGASLEVGISGGLNATIGSVFANSIVGATIGTSYTGTGVATGISFTGSTTAGFTTSAGIVTVQ